MKKLAVSLIAVAILAIGAPSFSANAFTNALNKTSNAIIEYNGESKTLIEWCEKYKLDYKRTHNRLFKLGWSFERAICEPVHKNKRNKATRNRKDKYTTN